MLTDLDKSNYSIVGERGLPENYPIPQNIDKLLFYIQRNLNMNTVVYALNTDLNGLINDVYPMKVFWIKYTDGGIRAELNQLQTKAFGYSSKKINNHTFEIIIDSYQELRFFIVSNQNESNYDIITKIQGKEAKLNNIYVFANEFGLFPKVEYIELYGHYLETNFPCFQKILI
jgi:hypothetical protein